MQSELSFGHIAAEIVVVVVDIDIAESVADVVAAVAAYSTGLLELWLCLYASASSSKQTVCQV